MKRRTYRWCLVAIVLAWVGVTFEQDTGAQGPASARRYRIIDLGTLGGTFSRANAINNRGEIAGESLMPDDGDVTAFYWQGGQMRQIAPYNPAAVGDSSGRAINNSGMVVGYYDPSSFPNTGPDQAFRYNPATDTLEFLGALNAVDINDAGQILVIGPNAQYSILGGATLPNFSASAINASGEVVGGGQSAGSGSFLYKQGQFFSIPDTAFGAADVNDSRQIVGAVLVDLGIFGLRTRVRMMRYDANTPPEFTTVLTYAPFTFQGSARPTAINNHGQIVGIETSTVSGRQVRTPFIIENHVVRRLDTLLPANSGWTLSGDFAEANDINDRGEIVGTGLINGEWHAFLLTPLECSALEDSDGDGNPDNDGDSLCDSWETEGIDGDGDGTIDLVLPGANLNHKDLYVEVDYMVSLAGGHGHRPRAQAIQKVIDAFDNAPLQNRDNSWGVTLHVEVDDFVPEIDQVLFGANGPGASDDFNDVKRGGNAALPCNGASGFFGTAAQRSDPNCEAILKAREMVYRYAIFGHGQADSPGSSGVAEIGGNDFLVSVGDWTEDKIRAWGGSADVDTAQVDVEAGTFMHEFGHTLGLRHGGADNTNCKPNYLSVMSYTFQFPAMVFDRPLDFAWLQGKTLDENQLDETLTFITGLANRFTVFGGPTGFSPVLDDSNGPIDWNLDGAAATSVSQDISTINGLGCGPTGNTFLTGFKDWDNLQYSFRHSPDFADGATRSTIGPDPELTADQGLVVAQSVDFDGDGMTNFPDNCPGIANPGQQDTDGDRIGDACESGPPPDVTPPILTLPADITVIAAGPAGAIVSFTVTALDGIDGPVPVTCAPASGAMFAIGITRVNCDASDASGNQAAGSFDVTVQLGQPRIAGTIAGRGRDAAGRFYVDLSLANTGTGHARAVTLAALTFRTLSGTGIVTYNAAASGPLPTSIGDLDVGGTAARRLFLNVPSTVTRFSMTEGGTARNVAGTTMSYAAAQSVIP